MVEHAGLSDRVSVEIGSVSGRLPAIHKKFGVQGPLDAVLLDHDVRPLPPPRRHRHPWPARRRRRRNSLPRHAFFLRRDASVFLFFFLAVDF